MPSPFGLASSFQVLSCRLEGDDLREAHRDSTLVESVARRVFESWILPSCSGWCSRADAFRPPDPVLVLGEHLVLGFRRDVRRVDGRELKSRVAVLTESWLREHPGMARIPKAIVVEFRDGIRKTLLEEVRPKTTGVMFGLPLDGGRGRIYGRASTEITDDLRRLFYRSFDVRLDLEEPGFGPDLRKSFGEIGDAFDTDGASVFLLWLWMVAVEDGGVDTPTGRVCVWVGRSVDLVDPEKNRASFRADSFSDAVGVVSAGKRPSRLEILLGSDEEAATVAVDLRAADLGRSFRLRLLDPFETPEGLDASAVEEEMYSALDSAAERVESWLKALATAFVADLDGEGRGRISEFFRLGVGDGDDEGGGE